MSEMRPIDANALYKSIVESYELLHKMYEAAQEEQELKYIAAQLVTFVECAMRVKDAPPIDAVPVVRCGDCKHAIVNENHSEKPLICCLTKMCGTTKKDWFCADGKRKMDGGETV